jgi:hypothetical protein
MIRSVLKARYARAQKERSGYKVNVARVFGLNVLVG